MSAIEDQLERDPHDAAAFLVYADWLLERGDPMGELIRVEHALASDPSNAELRARDERLRAELFPTFSVFQSEWKLGFPRSVSLLWVPDDAVEAVTATLRSPAGRFIEQLSLSGYILPKQREQLEKLMSSLPRLRHLTLSNNLEYLSGPRSVSNQILAVAGAAGRTLARLTLVSRHVSDVLSELPKFEKLEVLALSGAELSADDVGAVKLARRQVPDTCRLLLEGASCTFAAEDAISAVWPLDLAEVRGRGLIVEAPALHRGKFLLSGREGQRIGHHFACELSLPNAGLLAVQSVFEHEGLRPAGDLGVRPRKLANGDIVRFGDAVLRYCDDVARERAALRRR